MSLTFHRLVQQDLREILGYYEAVGGRALADRFFAELAVVVGEIEKRATSFHPVGNCLRRANMPSFPYHLLFREHERSIRVLVLRHHRRLPELGIRRR